MAHANAEKNNYSGFERFLFFLTPILFTAVLLGMLLLLFNTEWRNQALALGNKVPVLKAVLPDPSSNTPSASTDEQITADNARQKVDELKALLADRETALKQAALLTGEQKKTIADLTGQLDQLSQDQQQRAITTEQYQAGIKSLAAMYGKMTPSKAAPILESMTLEETALVLGAMGDAERGRVMEKMTPTKAADATIKLKDADSVENQQIAALQARVKELEKTAGAAHTLDTTELKQTFSAMKPANAAALLLDMSGNNQSKVLLILGSLGDNARSLILSAMSDKDSKKTSALVAKLLPAQP